MWYVPLRRVYVATLPFDVFSPAPLLARGRFPAALTQSSETFFVSVHGHNGYGELPSVGALGRGVTPSSCPPPPHFQTVVGSDPEASLVASLDHEGYLAYGMFNRRVWTDFSARRGPGGSQEAAAVLPGVPAFTQREARDKLQTADFTAPEFNAVSPRPANVVVCLDVAQFVQCGEEGEGHRGVGQHQ